MKAAKRGEIEDEIRSLLAAFEYLSTESKTNAAVVMMIANGLLTVGKGMWEAYHIVPWGGSVTMWLGEVISLAGGVNVIVPVVVGVLAVLALLFILLKEYAIHTIVFLYN